MEQEKMMKLSEEDTSKVMVNDLPEQSEYSYIIHAAQDTGKLLDTDFDKSNEANSKAWSGIQDLMARCIARGIRIEQLGYSKTVDRPDREKVAKWLFYDVLKTSTWAEAMLAWNLAKNDRQEKYYRKADQIIALLPQGEPPLLSNEQIAQMRKAKTDTIGSSLEVQLGEVAEAQRQSDIKYYNGKPQGGMSKEEAEEIVKNAAGRRPDFPTGKNYVDEVRRHDLALLPQPADRPNREKIAKTIYHAYPLIARMRFGTERLSWRDIDDEEKREFYELADQIQALLPQMRLLSEKEMAEAVLQPNPEHKKLEYRIAQAQLKLCRGERE